jgi:hypothetical protein
MPEKVRTLQILVRNQALTPDDLLALIEARRVAILPYLDRFTLSELGSVKILRNESFAHELKTDNPHITGDEKFSLRTQGIFRAQPWKEIQRFLGTGYQPGNGGVAVPNGIAVVWGLTRAGEWMLAEVHYHGEAGYKWRGYERAHTVHIRVVELVDVLQRTKETPEKILKALGEEVRAWVNHRRGLYNAAKALGDRISNEDMLFDLIDR